jgi:hypothetical protein
MNKLDIIKKKTVKRKKELDKFFKSEYQKVLQNNIDNGLEKYNFFASCSKDETDSLYGGEQCLEKDGLKIWKSLIWVNGNDIPEGVETIDGRFPIWSVSMWYSPFHYNNGMSVEELYDRSEKEKILYEDSDIRISWVRRNVIPFFKSVQYCHKMSQPEYIMYIKRQRNDKDAQTIKTKIDQLSEQIREYRYKNENPPMYLIEERKYLTKSLYYWHECVHDDDLNKLFTKAGRYFNDWY